MRYNSTIARGCILLGLLFGGTTVLFADAKLDSLMNAGKYKEAILHADKNVPAAKRSVDDWLNIASALDKTNAPMDRIMATLKNAQKANPSEPRVYLAFGIYAFKAKNYQEALKHFKKSYILERTAKAAEGIALSAANLNKWDIARDAAESAVSLNGDLFESRLILAKLYMKEKNFAAAVDQLEKIVEKKPDNVSYWKQLAVAYEKTNNVAGLAKVDPKIIDLDKKDVPSRQRHAKYSLANKDTKTALTLYKELAILTPNDPEVFKALYEITTSQGNQKDAVLYLKNYLVLDSTNAESHKALADMLYKQKDIDGALTHYRKALKYDPKIKGIYKNYVAILIDKKLEKEAVTVINKAITAGEADARAYIALGDIYKKQKKYQNAIKMYQEALKTEKANVAVLTSLGQSQAAAGDTKGAITTYEQVVMLNPKATEEQKTLGDLYMKLKRVDSAIKAYKEYLKKAPDDQKVAVTIGLHAYDKKDYKEAITYLEMVKDPKLQNVKYLSALGISYYHAKDYKKAAETIAKVRAKKPSATVLKSVLKLQGESYEALNDPAKAAEAYAAYTKIQGVKDPDASFKKAFLIEKSNKAGAIKAYAANTAIFPKDHRNFLRLGLIYAEDKGTYAKAASMLSRAAALVDTIPVVWETLGEVYGKLKKTTSELQAYQKLLKLKPQHLEANKRVGTILIKQKKYTQGISALEMTHTMAPKDVEVIMLLADGYLATKRPAQAIDLLEKAKAIKKDDVALREQLYELHKKTNKPKKAEDEIKGLIALTKENKYRVTYADDLIEQNRYEDAARILKQVVDADPENVTSLMLLGQVQAAQKKYDAAIETYKTVGYIKGPYAPAYTQRADVYRMMGNLAEAKDYFNKAIKDNAKYALAYLGLARVAKAEGKNADYTKYLNKAKALDPKNDEIKAELAGGSKPAPKPAPKTAQDSKK
ncbi:MAG: tetratricopeptide repeat protein [Chitinivibrionales bacterium]|nr:tetratricopeptide repeat protein [Chitinivibrionales bacterium]